MIGRDDDRDLIAAVRAGDREAFGLLVRRHQDRLYPTLLRLTGRPEDARDLLQDTFLKAYQKLHRFKGESTFFTWIYRIAVNQALSQRRRKTPVVPPLEPASRREPASDVRDTDPGLALERAEREGAVQRALNQLSAESRAVVVMKDLDGLRYEEIAGVLGIPVGTVRSRLHRARMELRQRLGGLVEETTARTPAGGLN